MTSSLTASLAAFRSLFTASPRLPSSSRSSVVSSISSLKLALATAGLLPPFAPALVESPAFSSSAVLAREFLELSCFAAIDFSDLPMFERSFNLLRAFYFDMPGLLGPSERQEEILGLHLSALIAQNRVSEFHTELELIAHESSSSSSSSSSPLSLKRSISSSNSAIASKFLQFPISLEQQLMEGAYNRVLKSKSEAPSPRFDYFLDLVDSSVRLKIAQCALSAMENPAASKLFLIEKEEFAKASEVPVNSAISDGLSSDGRAAHFHTIGQTLKFATEIERIV